jgi:peptidyl-prolyl cis-trans isomerase B (cyclophilin B)
MPSNTRQRQLRKLALRRAEERRRRRRQRILAGTVAGLLVLGGGGALAATLILGEEPTPSAMGHDPVHRAGGVACGAQKPSIAGEEKPSFDDPPEMRLDTRQDYRAVLRTSCGTIELDLYEDQAPRTVNNLVFLAREGFYDGLTFHRVVPGFVIQGGDPAGDGSGGPGYEFDDEIAPRLKFDQAGVLAMANSGADTNGSQFFITADPAPDLNGNYTIFGRVTEGLEVVREIEGLHVHGEAPAQAVYIERVTVEAR